MNFDIYEIRDNNPFHLYATENSCTEGTPVQVPFPNDHSIHFYSTNLSTFSGLDCKLLIPLSITSVETNVV
jgi:hypothetical protein